MTHYDILALGSYTIDLIFTGLPSFPELGKDIVGTGFDMIPGEAYNSAVAMHRLGIKVGWAADFGNDLFSRFALEHARNEGMDESLFVIHDRSFRRISVAASYPEDRAFITYYDPDPAIPAALKALSSISARAVYFPGFYSGSLFNLGEKFIRLKNMKIIMDGNGNDSIVLTDPAVRKTLQKVDIFFLNSFEARRLTGIQDIETAMRKIARLCPQVVLKDGPNGAYSLFSGELCHQPAIPVNVVDTTGAGDCFNAGFIRGWLDNVPISVCLQMGNIVGGLSTTARGGAGRSINIVDVQSMMSFYGSDDTVNS